jgi:hypothetical protein
MWDENNLMTTMGISVAGLIVSRNEAAAGGNGWESRSITATVKVNANDAVTIYMYGSTGSGSYPLHMGGAHWGFFSGHLIG